MKRTVLAGALAVSLSGVLASTAVASFHLNLIREIHDGTGTGGPDYVMLQAYSAGQNFVQGKHIVTYDGGGGVLSDYTIAGNVNNGANQATILISAGATPGADFPNVGTGANGLNVVNTGGAVCFTQADGVTGIDCVAYQGSFPATFPPVPPASPYGSPLTLGGQDLDGKSLVRSISRGCATALDAADDTNNSAADFSVAAPIARGNNATPTETPCPAAPVTKKKCKKKHKKKTGAYSAKKKCKKKKH